MYIMIISHWAILHYNMPFDGVFWWFPALSEDQEEKLSNSQNYLVALKLVSKYMIKFWQALLWSGKFLLSLGVYLWGALLSLFMLQKGNLYPTITRHILPLPQHAHACMGNKPVPSGNLLFSVSTVVQNFQMTPHTRLSGLLIGHSRTAILKVMQVQSTLP